MKRPVVGDVVGIVLVEGVVCLQYLGKHPEYGDAVAVCPEVQPAGVKIEPMLFKDAYITFYPLTTAVTRGFAKTIGHLPSVFEVPRRLRRAGVRLNGQIETWVIEDPPREEVVKRKLSTEDLLLPIASIWNHEFLLERIAARWRPETVGA
jgi:hypothetical protein